MTIILDALEHIQKPASAGAQVTDVGVRELLSRTAYGANRLAVLATTRYPIADARLLKQPLWYDVPIEPLSVEEGIALLRSRGWTGSASRLRGVVERFGGHPLTLDYALPASDAELPAEAQDVFAEYERVIAKSDEPKTTFSALWILSTLAGPVTAEELVIIHASVSPKEKPKKIEAAVRLLQSLNLVRKLPSSERLVMHDVLRDHFRAHATPSFIERVREEEVGRLTPRFEDENALLTERLDAGEAIVYHKVHTSRPISAFEFYWKRMGSFATLGNSLGEYGRGDRLCRVLNLGDIPKIVNGMSTPLARYLLDDPRSTAIMLLNDWALYQQELGEVELATAMMWRVELATMSDPQSSVTLSNVATLHLLRGALHLAADHAEQSIRAAEEVFSTVYEGFSVEESQEPWMIGERIAARAYLMTGEVELAEKRARSSAVREIVGPLSSQAELATFDMLGITGARRPSTEEFERANRAVASAFDRSDLASFDERFVAAEIALDWAKILARRGDTERAFALLRAREAAIAGRETPHVARDRLEIARVALRSGELAHAVEQCTWVEAWINKLESPGRALVVELSWLVGSIALAEHRPAVAWEKATAGLITAREAGFGILHIDLLILRAAAALALGDAGDARHCAATAVWGQLDWRPDGRLYAMPAHGAPLADEDETKLMRGIFPPSDTGRPGLLATTDHRCGYVWGDVEARELVVEAELLELAQHLKSTTAPAQHSKVRAQLETLRQIRDRWRPLLFEPSGSASEHARLERRIAALEAGELTTFPLTLGRAEETSHEDTTAVMVSYSHRDSTIVSRFADALSSRFPGVWFDRRALGSGDSIVSGINRALAEASDYVLMYSANARDSSWVQNEMEAAVYLRNLRPEELRIHLVQLDETPPPPLLGPILAIDYRALGEGVSVDTLSRALLRGRAGAA